MFKNTLKIKVIQFELHHTIQSFFMQSLTLWKKDKEIIAFK